MEWKVVKGMKDDYLRKLREHSKQVRTGGGRV